MNLDKETGISIMKIESKLDSGPVMMQSKIRIPEGTNSNILSSIMSKLGSEMIIKSLDLIEEKKEELFVSPVIEDKKAQDNQNLDEPLILTKPIEEPKKVETEKPTILNTN